MPSRPHENATSSSDERLRAPCMRVGRLRRRSEFLAVAGNRRKFVTPGLIVQIRRQTAPPTAASSTERRTNDRRCAAGAVVVLEPIRLGYTASRKVGNSVARNRARRRLRALAREILVPNAARGYDFVLIARMETVTRPWADLQTDLQTALRRLGAWKPGDSPARKQNDAPPKP